MKSLLLVLVAVAQASLVAELEWRALRSILHRGSNSVQQIVLHRAQNIVQEVVALCERELGEGHCAFVSSSSPSVAALERCHEARQCREDAWTHNTTWWQRAITRQAEYYEALREGGQCVQDRGLEDQCENLVANEALQHRIKITF